jgi:hypothetical protein
MVSQRRQIVVSRIRGLDVFIALRFFIALSGAPKFPSEVWFLM